MEKHKRDQVLVAVHDEARGFFGGLGVDDAAELDAFVAFVVGLLRVKFLVGDDAYGEASDARVAADHRFAILRLVLIEAAFIHDARENLLHIIGTRGRGVVGAVDFFGRHRRVDGLFAVEGRLAAVSPFVDKRTDAGEAGFVVGFAEVDGTADGGVHGGSAQFFGGNYLADGGLHERGAGEKQAAAVGHEDVIAHHGEISPARHAHAHDGRDLRDAHGRHDGVVAKDAAKIVGVWEDVFLQREEDSGGVDKVDGRDVIFDGDVLRANDFLRGHGKEGASLDGGIVDDEHDQA